MMKYNPINGFTKLKIIETIVQNNNGTQSLDPKLSECKYKMDGNACAVGCFLPDNRFTRSFIGDVGSLLKRRPSYFKLLPLPISALYELQQIHDKCYTPDNVQKKMLEWVIDHVEDIKEEVV